MSSRSSTPATGAAAAPHKQVYLILGPKKPKDQRCEDIATTLRREFTSAGWSVRSLRPKTFGSSPGTGSRPTNVLEPFDANALYMQAHRERVVVVQIAATQVLKNARSRPTPRNLMSLERFVRYKACFITASPEDPRTDVLASAEEWCKSNHCSSDDDPRCLPLHALSPDRDWAALQHSTTAFDMHHGTPKRRKDAEGRLWPKDYSAHSRATDVVAGHPMSRGFHWDIQSLSNESFVSNGYEVWSIGKEGHLNIYPDSFIRKGTKSKLKDRAERPAEALKNTQDGEKTSSPTAKGAPPPRNRRRRRRNAR